mmetsp:Transcript_24479/g.35995  ORF Transcript_24479/g.35995 Transcript_24479/m.35995 type:complete len:428 (-) Transcript_24479:225-1508(-)|eukprot:CAMPEP_0185029470 /NCGR_PEP_ID=MMETSP1103-20130426/15778_1 /TAXON_ID=36769 /ORGANISM="Paraphysomonas bandaiensis, Strain Caron Lab Isolate" /LENGTH=427 /DNA_ID=CAMNT_0027564221 /DNA_START=118 /DNA_END=1401 /DNA_ORIENTATION=-
MSDRDDFGLPIPRKVKRTVQNPTNPFDVDVQSSSKLHHPVQPSSNPFDEDYIEPPSVEAPVLSASAVDKEQSEIECSTNPMSCNPGNEDREDNVEEDAGDSEECPAEYRMSRSRQVARNSFRARLQRAERKLAKGGFGQEIVAVDSSDENAIVRFLLSQRVFGYPGTDGSVSSNYFQFIRNRHPLLGLFAHHRLHPFKTKLRVIVFLCTLSFAFVLTVAMLNDLHYHEKFICTGGCDEQHVADEHGNERLQCVGGKNDGMDYSEYKEHCQYYPPWMISAAAACIIVPYASLLKFLATCDCVHGRVFFQENCIGRGIKDAVEYLGGRVLFVFVVINVILSLAALYQAYVVMRVYTVLATFLYSKVLSFAYWFVWTAPYFSYKFPKDRKYFYKELLRAQNVGTLNEKQREAVPKRVNSRTSLLREDDEV